VNRRGNKTPTQLTSLMSVAYGKSGKEAGLDGQVIPAKKLEV